jgi:hypothetical protein
MCLYREYVSILKFIFSGRRRIMKDYDKMGNDGAKLMLNSLWVGLLLPGTGISTAMMWTGMSYLTMAALYDPDIKAIADGVFANSNSPTVHDIISYFQEKTDRRAGESSTNGE